MSEDRVVALTLALKAVLSVARKQGLSLEELTEAAADDLLQSRAYDAEHVAMAISEIKVAADALDYGGTGAGRRGGSDVKSIMDFEFFDCGIDQSRPLIYLWQIQNPKGEVIYRYVGKSDHGSKRPLTEYLRNVNNLRAGKPYRKNKPDNYREVHRRLADSITDGCRVSLYLLENVADPTAIYDVERAAKRLYCTQPFCELPNTPIVCE